MKHNRFFHLFLTLLLLSALVLPATVTADKLSKEGEGSVAIIAADADETNAEAEAASAAAPGAAAPAEEKQAKATWKTAPKITKIEMSGSSVKLTWKSAVQADSYVVFEYDASSKDYLELMTVSKTTATLKKSTLEKKAGFYEGRHTFAVRPLKKVDGQEVYGSYSKKKSFTVENASVQAPVLKSAKQTKDKVRVTWTAQKADQYEIYEVLANGKYKLLGSTTQKSITLNRADLQKAGGFAGTHTFAVRAMKKIDGKKKYSDYSKSLMFFVEIEGEETIGDYTFAMADDGNRHHVKITGYSGKSRVIQVPGTILDGHYHVKVIDPSVFAGTTTAKVLNMSLAIYLADIGNSAFKGCTNLETVTSWPENLEYIADHAFEGCTKLTSVDTLPDNIGTIGFDAFKGVPAWISVNADKATKTYQAALATAQHYDYRYDSANYRLWIEHEEGWVTVYKSFLLDYEQPGPEVITMPGIVERIGNSALSGFDKAWKIELPESLAVIENYAFSNNKALSAIIIPKSARLNGTNIFQGCTANLLHISVYEDSEAQEWAVKHAAYLADQGFVIVTIH